MKVLAIISVTVLLVLLFGCSRKKKGSDKFTEWLEANYPGRCKVLVTIVDDPIRNMSFKVKRSVVADSSDPDLQISIRWDAREAGLALSKADTDVAWAMAAAALQDARSLYKVLRTAGMEKVSASIYRGDAVVLIFAEPTPEQRQESLSLLQKALGQWPARNQYGLSVQFMEDSTYLQSFNEIVPLEHWLHGVYWHQRHTVLTLAIKHPYEPETERWSHLWEFNTQSDRMNAYIEQSRPTIQEWAEKQLKRPLQLLPEVEYSMPENPLVLRFRFAYTFDTTSSENLSANGFVTGDFDTDKKELKNIQFAQVQE